MKVAIVSNNKTEYREIEQGEIVEMQKAQKEYEQHKYDNMSYDEIVVSLIREKYSLDDELALQRQKDTKADEWNIYNDFCEECKTKSKKIIRNRELESLTD